MLILLRSMKDVGLLMNISELNRISYGVCFCNICVWLSEKWFL